MAPVHDKDIIKILNDYNKERGIMEPASPENMRSLIDSHRHLRAMHANEFKNYRKTQAEITAAAEARTQYLLKNKYLSVDRIKEMTLRELCDLTFGL